MQKLCEWEKPILVFLGDVNFTKGCKVCNTGHKPDKCSNGSHYSIYNESLYAGVAETVACKDGD